jgi:hypothetical protein
MRELVRLVRPINLGMLLVASALLIFFATTRLGSARPEELEEANKNLGRAFFKGLKGYTTVSFILVVILTFLNFLFNLLKYQKILFRQLSTLFIAGLLLLTFASGAGLALYFFSS